MARKIIEPITLPQVYKAVEDIFYGCKDGICQSYCNVVFSHRMVGKELYAQIMYILTNAGSFKGPEARAAKEVLNIWYKQHTQRGKTYGYVD